MPMSEPVSELPADRLTFGLKLVCSLVVGVATICLFIVNITMSAKQELNDLKQGLKEQKISQDTQIKIEDERSANMIESIKRIDRLLNVEAYEISTLKYSMSQAGIKIRYPPSKEE